MTSTKNSPSESRPLGHPDPNADPINPGWRTGPDARPTVRTTREPNPGPPMKKPTVNYPGKKG